MGNELGEIAWAVAFGLAAAGGFVILVSDASNAPIDIVDKIGPTVTSMFAIAAAIWAGRRAWDGVQAQIAAAETSKQNEAVGHDLFSVDGSAGLAVYTFLEAFQKFVSDWNNYPNKDLFKQQRAIILAKAEIVTLGLNNLSKKIEKGLPRKTAHVSEAECKKILDETGCTLENLEGVRAMLRHIDVP